ncbi:MAG: aspartate carbamoyltransferase catalytic subunit [Roseovarius sp.]
MTPQRTLQTRDNSWDGLLAKDERILWQGQPSQKLSARPGEIFESLFGVFFTGFSIFWMSMAYSMGGGPFWMFGLIFFFLGLYQVFGKYLWKSYQRGHTWYTLSDRAAYIAKDSPLGGRSLASYPITPDTELEFKSSTLSSVYFASETYRANGKNHSAKVGFENLTDGRAVYDQMLEIQRGDA